MKQFKNLQFQSERLKLLANRLITMNEVPRIKVLESTSNLFMYDNRLVGQFPMFFGVVTLMPKLWPQEWTADKNGNIQWKKNPLGDIIESLMAFFSLDFSMLGHLYIPGAQNVNLYGGKILNKFSSSVDIAFNIHSFISSQKMAMELLDKINISISKN